MKNQPNFHFKVHGRPIIRYQWGQKRTRGHRDQFRQSSQHDKSKLSVLQYGPFKLLKDLAGLPQPGLMSNGISSVRAMVDYLIEDAICEIQERATIISKTILVHFIFSHNASRFVRYGSWHFLHLRRCIQIVTKAPAYPVANQKKAEIPSCQ